MGATGIRPTVQVTIPPDLWECADASFMNRDPEVFGMLAGGPEITSYRSLDGPAPQPGRDRG